MLARADGVSVVQESMYDNRFGHVNELVRMGANIKVEGRTAIVEGVPKLVGAPVKVSDLRAGASLIIAGLSAHGVTEVNGMEIVQRGYEMMPEKLRSLGADVTEEDE